MLTLVSAVRQQCEPFYLDMTDGARHHILYRTQNNHVMVHTNCTPVEVRCFTSDLPWLYAVLLYQSLQAQVRDASYSGVKCVECSNWVDRLPWLVCFFA